MLAFFSLLLVSCSNDSKDSSNSDETTKGQLKVTKTERTITSLGKVKDEEIEQYFYDNGKLVSKKYQNTIASVAQNDSKIDDYYYDESGKLIKTIVSSKSVFENSFVQEYIYEYSYNDKGQISQGNKQRLRPTEKKFVANFYYDNLGRLIKETNSDFIDIFTTTYSYYDSSFNLKGAAWSTEFDNKVNMSRFLSPTKAYADAQPYSANNVLIGSSDYEHVFNYDSENRVTKETSKDDYNYTYETIYDYID